MSRIKRFLITIIVPLLAATKTVAAISGTFIQPWLTAGWDDERWQKEYAMLAEAGMDKIIFMHTAHTSKDGVCSAVYPTKISDVTPSETDMLDMCLRNAAKSGFKVIVGLNFDERWWDTSMWTPEWVMGQMELGNRVAKELADSYLTRYPDIFAGWYWGWEIEDSFLGAMPQLTDYLVKAMNINLDYLKEITPTLPVMVSPFMNSKRSNPDNCSVVWGQILSKAHFKDGDIFAPQDCVGAGFLKIDESGKWFKALSESMPASPKIRFWANIESFDQQFWTSAPLNRIKTQIDNVSPYVSGMITFAYSHYYSPLLKNPDLHKAYCHYATTGQLPDCPTPKAVRKPKIIGKGKERLLKWTRPSEEHRPLGYHIYNDNILAGDIQPDMTDGEDEVLQWRIPEDMTGDITIKAYNAIGDSSPAVKLTL